jgi:hypothetical protein
MMMWICWEYSSSLMPRIVLNQPSKFSQPLLESAIDAARLSYLHMVYSRKICATCEAPLSLRDDALDIEHPVCTNINTENHQQLACLACESKFSNLASPLTILSSLVPFGVQLVLVELVVSFVHFQNAEP